MMVQIALRSGAYSSESLIANAQRSVNLFVESNPENTAPTFPTTHYVRPGLKLRGAPAILNVGRCLYGATNGDLYAVVGLNVYYVDPDLKFNQIGVLVTNKTTPVYMADNGSNIVVVDGSPNGFNITMNTRTMTTITDPN